MTNLRALLGDRYDAVMAAPTPALARDRTSWSWSTYEAALTAVLPELLADVWDDGHAACIEAHGRIKPTRPNPYRPETITRDATDAPVTPAAPDAINPPPDPSAAVAEPHNTEGA